MFFENILLELFKTSEEAKNTFITHLKKRYANGEIDTWVSFQRAIEKND